MRHACTALLLTCCITSGAQVAFDPDLLHVIAASEAHRQPAPLLKSGNPSRGYDVRYHRLELVVDPAVRAVQGEVTHHFSAMVPLSEVLLDLSSALTVNEVRHQGQPIAFAHVDDRLSVTLSSPLAVGAIDSLTIAYAGVPPETGFGSFIQAEHDGAPIIWTLSEPYGARDWWPCKQDLNDKADSLDLIVTVPTGNRVAGNGVLANVDDLGNGQVRHHWRHRHPINYYLVAFAATNYEAYSDFVPLDGSTVEVLNYVFPENLNEWQSASPQIIEQMQLFSDLFGTYPFADEKYGHAQFGWGGGMEHQTMSFMGATHYELMSHELAHQWFGNLVTCGSWEDLWLNEGFASYLSGLCYEFLAPEYWMPFKQGRRNYITSQPGGSVLVSDTTSIPRLFDSRLTYAKGAFLLHMLRWVCGDDAFFQGLNTYLNDPSIRNGSALTGQLVAHLEAASGVDLTEFMQDWYAGEGYPTYQMQWTQTLAGEVTALLEQSTSHASVDFFEMPVPVRFWNETQSETVVVGHTSSGQAFDFTLPFQADSAAIDPGVWILSGQNLVLKVPVLALGADRLFIYPNPVTENAWLHLGAQAQGPIRLDVTDATGRLVRSVASPAEGLRVALPLEGLSGGCYAVRALLGERTVDLRFVKQ
ncbi:MAG: peptidase M1 [Flavobacteriales bacterium]|nr:peptidase M1 [Flavobacteriales bacterium]